MKKLKKSKEGVYTFWDGDEQLCTPGGMECSTVSEALAKRILADWKEFGMSFGGDSVLPWHFTYQENFLRLGEEKVREILIQCFNTPNEWTFHCEAPDPHVYIRFKTLFGDFESRWGEIEKWLSGLNLYQLTAACCVGNAFHSLNLAFVFSILHSQCKIKRSKTQALKDICEFVEFYEGDDSAFVKSVFELFELYWDVDSATPVRATKKSGNSSSR